MNPLHHVEEATSIDFAANNNNGETFTVSRAYELGVLLRRVLVVTELIPPLEEEWTGEDVHNSLALLLQYI